MSLFIMHEVLYNRGKETMRFIEPEPLNLDNLNKHCRINANGLYNMYVSSHKLSPYRFSYDRFVNDKHIEYEIYEIKNPNMMDNKIFYDAISDLGIDKSKWYSDGKILLDKSFNERKRICDSFVTYTEHKLSKDLQLIESMDAVGNCNYLSWRTNISENYNRKYKAGDKVMYGIPSTIVNLGPDDSIPYSCIAWSERYCLIQDDDTYQDWVPESDLIAYKGG